MDAQMEGVEATMTDTIQHAEKGEEASSSWSCGGVGLGRGETLATV